MPSPPAHAPGADATTDHPVLSRLLIGYAPMLDRQRAITAMRLTLFPTRPDKVPDVGELQALLAETWPVDAGRLALNLVGEALVERMLQADWPPHLMLELPAFMAHTPEQVARIATLHQRGHTLMLKGRPLAPLPREALPYFAYSLIDLADERRDGLPPPGGTARQIPHVQAGVNSLADVDTAFRLGAAAVMGWPLAGTEAVRRSSQPQMQVVVELIKRVDRGESAARLEAVLKNDPTLAYKLLRLINSAAFGLSVEVSSLGHAVQLLGYQRLHRWLVLLLAAGAREMELKPLVYAAVRRGLVMEELGRATDVDEAGRGELFMTGVFSLLDRLMLQPMAHLLDSVATAPAVRAALLDEAGPLAPYLALACAVEASAVHDIRARADELLVAVPTLNRAVLAALAVARQIDLA